ncbi:MAG: hypothetical protein GTO63_04335 [Anaerolineae bacterium]|nr:hypothetical protein [Anaerolineae bacterium]NIQ77307.1 hypothetical protein [Anaerolineae bacterium]
MARRVKPTSSKETKKSVIGKLRLAEMRQLAKSYGIFLPRQVTKKELQTLLENKLDGLSLREVKGKIQRVKSESELPIESRELRKVIIRLRAKLAACESENRLLTEMLGKRARAIEKLNRRLEQLEGEPAAKDTSKEMSVGEPDQSMD